MASVHSIGRCRGEAAERESAAAVDLHCAGQTAAWVNSPLSLGYSERAGRAKTKRTTDALHLKSYESWDGESIDGNGPKDEGFEHRARTGRRRGNAPADAEGPPTD